MTTKERQKGKTELGWTQAPGLTRAAASSYAMGGSYTPAPAYGAALQNKELKELDLKPVERKETPKAPPTVRVPASMPKGTDPAALALAARRNEAAVKQTQARKEQERRTAQTSVAETTAQATAPVSVSMPTQFSASNYLTGEASMPVTPYAAGLQAGIVKTPKRKEKPMPLPLPMDPEPLVFDHLSRRQKEQALETAKRMEKMPLFSGGLTTPEQNRALIDQLNKELEREDIIAMGFDPRWLALSRKQGLLTEEEKTEARAAAEQLAAQPLQVRYQEAQRAAGASPYGQIPAMLSFERSMTPEETELFKAQYALGTALADRAGMSGPFAAAAGLVSALPGASWADREGTKAQQAMTPKPFRSPLTPEGWSPYTQAREEHPVAYGAGAVAGNVGVTLAGGKLADAAVKTTPLLRHLPKAAQTVLSTGLNFGGQAALRTAENGGDAGQIVKAGVTNALAGMAGQGVGQMVHGGAVKLLGHLNLSNSIPANVAASATEGVSFAGTQMGTRMLLDEDYRPSGGEAAVDLTSAAAFSALSRYLQTRAQSKEAAVRLQADAEDMKRDFQRIANNVYVNGPEATLDDLELKIARTRGAINANTYMGQQETVNAINEFLDTLDEAISMKRLELGAIPGTAVDAGSVTGAPAYGWEAPAFTPNSESTNGGGGYLMGLVPEIPPRPVQQSPRDILSRLAWEMAAGDDPLGDLAKDDMLAILDQIARRQSGEVTEQTDKAEPLILAENELLPTEEDGTMLSETVSGALNPTGKAAREHAKRYYGLIRKMKTDVARIAKNTGYGSDQIMQIKQYLFFDSHILSGGKRERFAPDYDMAQSWKRLLEGVDIQEHDLTLLKHEMMEMELVASGMSQAEAHKRTSAIYNYAKEVEEYNDRIKKYKDQR